MTEVVFDNITKRFGDFAAVSDMNLRIESGSLVALLGPSGCGKTTSLRMLGGFVTPTVGTVNLGDKDVTRLPPHKRNTAMVFQSYALFPHLTVEKNIAYGLKRRGVQGPEIRRRVAEVIEMVRIPELAKRYPAALSGGQRQRVAVARAVVLRPDVLLLDEPFSALDAQVRESTRIEMRRIQRETGITALLVTHDQQEAMSIADKVVVMNAGKVEQVGTPMEIYDQPATKFVAEFIGAANMMQGHVRESEGEVSRFETLDGLEIRFCKERNPGNASKGYAVIRGEDIAVAVNEEDRPRNANEVSGRVIVSSFLGTSSELVVQVAGRSEIRIRGDRTLALQFPVGTNVGLSWPQEAVHFIIEK